MVDKKKSLRFEALENRVAPLVVVGPILDHEPAPIGGGGGSTASDPVYTEPALAKHDNPGWNRKVQV